MNITPQLQAVIDGAAEGRSIIIQARSGSGKTTALQECAARIPGTGVCTSFSRETTAELKKRMPSRFQARTSHSLCLEAVRRSGDDVKVDQDKTFNLVKAEIERQNLDWDLQAPIASLVAAAKTHGIVPGQGAAHPDLPFSADTHTNWEALADHYDILFDNQIWMTAKLVLEQSNNHALGHGVLDFDDMLYVPLRIKRCQFPLFPTILVDEYQDLTALQILSLRRMLMPGGRLIAAGDDRQSIYAFRGAMPDAFERLIRHFNLEPLPLTVSFRCPQRIIAEAQRYVPDIEAAPGAPLGLVKRFSHARLSSLPKTSLCRYNAPLTSLALQFLVAGRTAEVAGVHVGKGLVALTKRISKKNLSSTAFLTRLERWAEREISRKPKTAGRTRDKAAALTVLARHHKRLDDIRRHLLELYPDPNSNSYRPAEFKLSTIHRAKGLEWDHVLFLDSHLIPSAHAKTPADFRQESNLAYVGITRARKSLTFCASAAIHN